MATSLTGTATALVKASLGPGGLELVEREPREPGPGEVAIDILATGICGTDLEIVKGAAFFDARMRPPVVIGHEGCGIVAELGPAAAGQADDGLRVGDLVSIESHLDCGSCHSCRAGRPHVCDRLRYVGIDFDGVMTDRAVLPRRVAVRLPESVPVHLAALLEPLGVAVRAVMEGGGVAGRDVLVTGAGGPIGMMAVAVARRLGADRVLAAEVAPHRLELLREHASTLGLDAVLDPSEADLVALVRDATDGKGTDVLIDLSGGEAAIRAGIEATTAGGQARLLAASAPELRLEVLRMILREISVFTVHGRLLHETWQHMIRLTETLRPQLDLVISDVLPFEAFDEAFELARSGSGLKVLLAPDPAAVRPAP